MGSCTSDGCVSPFFSIDGRLFPIGTAFAVGRGVCFVLSAYHCIRETFNHEPSLKKYANDEAPKQEVNLEFVNLWILHQDSVGDETQLKLCPLEHVAGVLPTDVIFGSPQFTTDVPVYSMSISFGFPAPSSLMWSVGYCNFKCPDGGISQEEIADSEFVWSEHYSHDFMVFESSLVSVFTRKFANGFVDGPCFTHDSATPHGLSGGPVFCANGCVIGINSAGAELFHSSPHSIASLIYPLFFTKTKFGTSMGILNLSTTRYVYELIAQGVIGTDGKERELAIFRKGNLISFGPGEDSYDRDDLFEDFGDLQAATAARVLSGHIVAKP